MTATIRRSAPSSIPNTAPAYRPTSLEGRRLEAPSSARRACSAATYRAVHGPDFAAVARAPGRFGRRVERSRDLTRALREALAQRDLAHTNVMRRIHR